MSGNDRELASVSGGKISHADTQEMAALAGRASHMGRTLRWLAAQWQDTRISISGKTTLMRLCTIPLLDPRLRRGVHDPAFLSSCERACRRCDQLSTEYANISRTYSSLSDALARASGLYSHAEETIQSLCARALSLPLSEPRAAAGSMGTLLGATALSALPGMSGISGGLLDASDGLQETVISSTARIIDQATGQKPSTNPVGDAASELAHAARIISLLFKGNTLTVTQMHPAKSTIGASHSISDALANEAKLASAADIPYCTVAVQKYQDLDGTVRWLVIIPGTQTHLDAAIGWSQNIELMSSRNEQRMSAESTRLVLQAMKESGIKKGDHVCMVGHSQGGIVAATIASGKTGYCIDHIVTAGSPIANHPIPSSTWVTSVENRGELVSRLDGAHNPQRRTWLTVNGSRPSHSVHHPEWSPLISSGFDSSGSRVQQGKDSEMTHSMNYQQATWHDATQIGSPAVIDSDQHFRNSISGKLVSTQYFTGRISHSAPVQSHEH